MRKTLTLIALMLMACVSAMAQINPVPQIMQFQGRLAKPDGTPIPNGSYSVRFSLWTAATGGTEKWNQTINPVAVKNGTFAVQLNTSTGAADKFNNNLFLEIKVGSDAPLSPRQPLASVAYAMKADSIKDGAITSASIASGAVTSSKIADGAVTSAKLDSSLQGMLGGFSTSNDLTALVGAVSIGGPARGVAVSGNNAYVIAGQNGGALLVYDLSNPTAPVYRGSVAMAETPKALAVAGNHAYITTDFNSNLLLVYDVSNPANPTRKGSIATANTPTSVAASGNYAYVVGGINNLQIFNVSNAASPFLQGGTTTTGTVPTSVAVSGNFAFVTTRGNGGGRLQSIDVSNRSAPVARGLVETGLDPRFVTVSGNYAYVTHLLNGGPLQIFSISNPAAPVFVNNIVTATHPVSVAVSGPLAYVVTSSSYLQVFYIAAPLVPLYIEGVTTRRGHTSVAANNNVVCVVDQGNLDASGMLQVFSRRTQGINSNFAVRGGGFFYGGLDLDQGALNNGGLASGLTFGPASGEGIASKRTYGGNQWGLDFYTAYLNRMTITNDGKVGIGTTAPSAPLEVNGTARATFFSTTSDARYKQNVATLENPLDTILNLRGVTYEWKQKEFPDKNFAAGRQIGFLAQEVEKVLPELVMTDAKGYKSVAYANVVPVMVEAMKQQQAQVSKLSAENTTLKQQLAELSELVRQIQAAQETLRANTTGK